MDNEQNYGLGLIGSSIIGGLGGLISNGINAWTQNRINDSNLAMVQNENSITRRREDTAIVRRARDLQAAGINPLLAGIQGAQASAGQLIPMQAPQLDLTGAFKNIMSAITEAQKMQNSDVNEKTRINLETNKLIDDLKTSEENRKLIKKQVETMSIQDQNTMQNTLYQLKQMEKIDSEVLTAGFQRALIEAQTDTERKRIGEIAAHITQMRNAAKKDRSETRVNNAIEVIKKSEWDRQEYLTEKLQKEIAYLSKTTEMLDSQAMMDLLGKITEGISNGLGTSLKVLK
nr:MAG TPA: minor capsid protein [Microviridae sp.]